MAVAADRNGILITYYLRIQWIDLFIFSFPPAPNNVCSDAVN